MAFKIEDIVGMRVPFVNPLDGSLQLREVQEVMYQGNIVWPLAQAYTYVIESVTAYDAGGHEQPNPMLLASGLLKLHYLGTVRKMLGSTLVETLTNQPLTPLSHAPVQGVNFIADQLEYYNESRGEMVGSEIDTSVLLTFRDSLGFEASLKVQANELLARIVDMSAASATPSSLSDISKDGTIMQVAYVSRCAVTRTYTAGTYGGEVEDAPLDLCVDIEGGQPVIQQVQGGTGFVYVTIPPNYYQQRRKISVYMQDAISGEKSAIAEVYQQGTATVVGSISVEASIEPDLRTVFMTAMIAEMPSELILTTNIRNSVLHLLPDGGVERTYNVGDIFDISVLGIKKEVFTLPAPETDEEGNCWLTGSEAEHYNIQSLPVTRYVLHPASTKGFISLWPSVRTNSREFSINMTILQSVGYTGPATMHESTQNYFHILPDGGTEQTVHASFFIGQTVLTEGTPLRISTSGVPDKAEAETGLVWFSGFNDIDEYFATEFPKMRYSFPARGTIRIYPTISFTASGNMNVFVNMEILHSEGYTGAIDIPAGGLTMRYVPDGGTEGYYNAPSITGLSEDSPKRFGLIAYSRDRLGMSGTLYFDGLKSDFYFVEEYTQIRYQFPDEQ